MPPTFHIASLSRYTPVFRGTLKVGLVSSSWPPASSEVSLSEKLSMIFGAFRVFWTKLIFLAKQSTFTYSMSCIFWKLLFPRPIYQKHFLSILRGVRSLLTQWDAYKLNPKLRRTVSHKKWLSECRWNPCSVSKNVIDWLDLFDLFWMDKELHSAHGCQIRWKIQKQNSSSWYLYPLQNAANHGKINLSVMALRSCTYGPLFCS